MKIVLFSLNASRSHTNLAIRILKKRLEGAGFQEVSLIERTEKERSHETLAALVGLKNVETVGEDGIARVGELEEEITLEQFAQKVKKALSVGVREGEAGIIACPAGRGVRRVALVGGSGGGEIGLAKSTGADTYLTGDLKYHEMLSSTEHNINLVCAGHFFTEYPVCAVLERIVGEACPEAEVKVEFSNIIVEY